MDSYWGEGINLGKPELFDPQPSRARPTFARPPMEFSDEVALKLTPDGLLRYFRRRPASIVSDGFGPSDADLRWNDWFPEERTGYSLETEKSRSSTTRGEGPLAKKVSLERSRVPTPPDAFDVVRLWEHNDDNGNLTRIVAAAFQGQPVYFEIYSSDEPEEAEALPVWKLQELMILVATVALAWWNIRSGRGDRRGALRLTQVVCSIGMVIWFTQTRHLLFEGFEVEVVTLGMAQVLFDGARMWLMYVAFEPLVRRFWPELLISAMRLLRGQYRDPRVGRDLLVGVAAGLVVVVIHRINMFVNLEMMNSKFNHQTYFNAHSLLGPMELLGAVLDAVVWSITVGGSVVMFLVIVRLAVRSGRVATAICVVLATYTLSVETASDPSIAWLTVGLWMIGNYWVIVRFGYLAFVTVLVVYFLACRLPVTLDASMWYSQYSLLVNACIAAIAAYGFYVSQGIRPRPAAVQRVE